MAVCKNGGVPTDEKIIDMSSCNFAIQFLLCGSTSENIIETKTALSVIDHGAIVLDGSIARFLRLPQSAIYSDITTPVFGGVAWLGCYTRQFLVLFLGCRLKAVQILLRQMYRNPMHFRLRTDTLIS